MRSGYLVVSSLRTQFIFRFIIREAINKFQCSDAQNQSEQLTNYRERARESESGGKIS